MLHLADIRARSGIELSLSLSQKKESPKATEKISLTVVTYLFEKNNKNNTDGGCSSAFICIIFYGPNVLISLLC